MVLGIGDVARGLFVTLTGVEHGIRTKAASGTHHRADIGRTFGVT